MMENRGNWVIRCKEFCFQNRQVEANGYTDAASTKSADHPRPDSLDLGKDRQFFLNDWLIWPRFATFPRTCTNTPASAPCIPQPAVQQALEQCHQEIFERILETPLVAQEEDLRAHLSTMPNGSRRAATQWRRLEGYRSLLPADSAGIPQRAFCSNVRAILEILEKEPVTGTGSRVPFPRRVRQFRHRRESSRFGHASR